VRSAELTKYAANAMLATKISFMNELARIAEQVGADIEKVRVGIGSDTRIGYSFMYPGAGYGGSCFPKDVQALVRTSQRHGLDPLVLQAVEGVNRAQKRLLFEKIHAYFRGELAGRTIALWGLAFKPNTDDMREASSRVLMEALWQAGASVRAFDPVAMHECARIYGPRSNLTLCASAAEALEGADTLAIVTEWKEFRSPDFDLIRRKLKTPAIFDGRNLYDPALVARFRLDYYAIGRGKSVKGS
jgi:UDPglucose 6-dehydrogenase